MAIDSKQKRSSAIGLRQAWVPVLPDPDGAVSQADRQDVAFSYAGIAAGAQVFGAISKVLTARAINAVLSLRSINKVLTVRN